MIDVLCDSGMPGPQAIRYNMDLKDYAKREYFNKGIDPYKTAEMELLP